MDAISKINWDTVDNDKILGDYVPLPNGRKQYVEMTILHWYWLDFANRHGDFPVEEFVEDTLEGMREDGWDENHPEFDETFEFIFSYLVMSFGKNWVELSEGKKCKKLIPDDFLAQTKAD